MSYFDLVEGDNSILKGMKKTDDLIFNGNYSCDYPGDPDVDNIKCGKISFDGINRLNCVANVDESGRYYSLPVKGDICQNITFYNVKHSLNVKIVVGGILFFECYYPRYTGHLTIKPFIFGLPIVVHKHQEVKIYFIGEHADFGATYLYLSDDDRKRIISDKMEFPGMFRTEKRFFV